MARPRKRQRNLRLPDRIGGHYVRFHVIIRNVSEGSFESVLNERGYRFQVMPNDSLDLWGDGAAEKEVFAWCTQNIHHSYTMEFIHRRDIDSVFFFTDLADATLFKLRWG